ncbi:DUF4298 domain-containing protein [Neisseria chenwenguii]|nr:DUF4298 domain-containing protein [Neisseria chenwenguii]
MRFHYNDCISARAICGIAFPKNVNNKKEYSMLDEQRLNQIRQMEQTLNDATELMAKIEQLQEEWKNQQPHIQALLDYYFQGDWRADYEAFDNGNIPQGMSCGVLSEDAVFNLISDQQRLSIEAIKLAVKALER